MDESQHLLWSCLDFINLGLGPNPVLSFLFFKNDLTRRIVAKSELRLLLWKQLTLFLLTIFSNFIFGLRTTTSTGNSLVFFMWSNQTFIPPKRIHPTQIKVQEIQVSHYLYSNLQNPGSDWILLILKKRKTESFINGALYSCYLISSTVKLIQLLHNFMYPQNEGLWPVTDVTLNFNKRLNKPHKLKYIMKFRGSRKFKIWLSKGYVCFMIKNHLSCK